MIVEITSGVRVSFLYSFIYICLDIYGVTLWSVEFETQLVEDEVRAMIGNGALTRDDIKVLRAWTDQVEMHGPESLRTIRFYDDHALDFEWEGYRSSAFSNRGRIIYKVIESKVVVRIARITPVHDYAEKPK